MHNHLQYNGDDKINNLNSVCSLIHIYILAGITLLARSQDYSMLYEDSFEKHQDHIACNLVGKMIPVVKAVT